MNPVQLYNVVLLLLVFIVFASFLSTSSVFHWDGRCAVEYDTIR